METNPKDFRNAKRSDMKWGAIVYLKEEISGGLAVYKWHKISKLSVRNTRAKVGEDDFKHRQRIKKLNQKIIHDYKQFHEQYYIKENGQHEHKRKKRRVASLPPRKPEIPQPVRNWK